MSRDIGLDEGLSIGSMNSYLQKVRSIRHANLIGLWPLDEKTGSIARDVSGNGHHGAYSSVDLVEIAGIGDGRKAPFFDGSNALVNLYSAALASAFNGQEGSLSIWLKINAAQWTDSANRCALHLGSNGATNFIRILKGSTNNQIQLSYVADSTSDGVSKSSYSVTAWAHYAITWSLSAGVDGQVKCYIAGSQEGSTSTGLGTYAGDLASTLAVIGAQTSTGALDYIGYAAYLALWAGAGGILSSDDVARLAAV